MKLKVAGYTGLLVCILVGIAILAQSKSAFSDVELISLAMLAILSLVSLTLIAFSGKVPAARQL
jgi:hypothetical protein